MPHSIPCPRSSPALASVETVWRMADQLFDNDVTPAHALTKPITLRMPFVFYLGHLSSFASNSLLSTLSPRPKVNTKFDHLFSRGIDPNVDDPTQCHDHPAPPPEWPAWHEVVSYRDAVRAAVRAAAASGALSERRLTMVAEHEAMHLETLRYMLAQRLRLNCGPSRAGGAAWKESGVRPGDGIATAASPFAPEWMRVDAGTARTGVPPVEADAFVWDNEHDTKDVHVAAFAIARTATSVAEFAAFVRAGGYAAPALWEPGDWEWVRKEGMRCPATWEIGRGAHHLEGPWRVLTAGGKSSEQADVARMPASVSLAEARAYAAWRGCRLPTEGEWVRAAFGDVDAEAVHGAQALAVRAEPGAVETGMQSWCGAVGMVGNGWEVTTTEFAAFEGFQAMAEYPEYSADFFDGKHFVMRGASWATPGLLVRKSFRNFYQARYPYVFSKVRLVQSG